MKFRLFFVALLMLMFSVPCRVIGFPQLQQQIPNGNKVPNPCNRTLIWAGVGHQANVGSGPRNPFGNDFQQSNYVWNKAICEMDSDGDGLTNGQELGDASCRWTVGSNPSRVTNLTHPGICEPLDSALCLSENTWLNCKAGFSCPAVSNTGVENATLRLPVTPVPNVQTTYICQAFALPNNTDNDIIAFEPIVNNSAILHHMLIYGCNSEPSEGLDYPFSCGMGGGPSCLSLVGIWSVGMSGQCLNSQLGFRIGPTGFQYAMVQLHWNNYMLSNTLTDSSGFRIYYTSQLRPNRGEILISGQQYLNIEAYQASVSHSGGCSSQCTQKLPHSIYLTTAILHMHLLGVSGNITLNRNGAFVNYLDVVAEYSFNSPIMLQFDPPIQVNPGDEIRVNCDYSSLNKNSTTNYGDSTSDEMCYGFFAYYPLVENFDQCNEWKSIQVCDSAGTLVSSSCDLPTFLQLVFLLPDLGCAAANCSARSCSVVVDGVVATGCAQQQDVIDLLATFYGPTVLETLQICAEAWPAAPKTNVPPTSATSPSTSVTSFTSTTLMTTTTTSAAPQNFVVLTSGACLMTLNILATLIG